MDSTDRRRALAALLAAFCLAAAPVSAQFAERSALVGSGQPDVDASGRSVKNPRTRAVHSDDPDAMGGTAWLLQRDPYLAYQLGRNLNFREFRPRDGVFATSLSGISGFGGPMVDGTTAKITANNQTSCLGCHNQPYGNPGGGNTFAKDSGRGRNAPHYFGAGIVEMLAIQNRTTLMKRIDSDEDGWISVAESAAAPPLLVETTEDGRVVDYGSAALDGGLTGRPQFNRIIRVWYGLDTGLGIVRAPGASAVDGVTATHYNFEIVVWGWGQRAPPSALNPTNRAFLWDPFAAHSGLQAHDPSTADDPDGDGVSEPTLAGAVQFPATHLAPDAGTTLDPLGFSTDDPDGDGSLNEISEGDLDLGEWFMLNAPRPAFAGSPQQYAKGLKAMGKLGCTACHVPDWTILPADDDYAGDRRLFDFEASWSPAAGGLEGRLVALYDKVGDDHVRRLDGFEVRGLFSDLAQHDMGSGFAELAYDGSVNTVWRTPPLWGVGSGFPWGHDGASLTLADVIARHGGEAAASAAAWSKAGRAQRRKVLDFLESLVLYDIETLPADIDGNGVVSDTYVVAGENTGVERFNAEWLFRVPVQIQGMVLNADDTPVRSNQAVNLIEAYGLDLPLRQDVDLDGWPDVWDNAPDLPGYRDGVN